MKHSHQKKDTVRLTIDFPLDQHIYIKMLAAKEGISLRQFVIQHLPNLNSETEKHDEIQTDDFDLLLKNLLVEKAAVLKRLSKK